MKTLPAISIVCAASLLFGLATAQSPAQPEQDVATLRAEVAALRAEVDKLKSTDASELETQLEETRALVDQLAEWSRTQAAGADALTRALTDSQEKGFTFGINPESREVLLAGIRSFAGGMQQGVPEAAKEPEPTGRRGRR